MKFTSLLLLFFYVQSVLADGNVNQVSKNPFGDFSVIYWFYFFEIVIACVAYIKIRNPIIFAGLALVIALTHLTASLIGH